MILCAATSGWCSYLVSQSDCEVFSVKEMGTLHLQC